MMSSELSHMAPLAKPMMPRKEMLARRERGHVATLARSSSLEGSTVSDTAQAEGSGQDAALPGGRREGQVRR